MPAGVYNTTYTSLDQLDATSQEALYELLTSDEEFLEGYASTLSSSRAARH